MSSLSNFVLKPVLVRDGKYFLYVFTKLSKYGSLRNYLYPTKNYQDIDFKYKMRVAAQCIACLHALHLNNVVHRDIKFDNFVVNEGGRIQITDFGLAEQILPKQKLYRQCGTEFYVSIFQFIFYLILPNTT